MTYGSHDEALKALQGTGPELRNGAPNHAPMVDEAKIGSDIVRTANPAAAEILPLTKSRGFRKLLLVGASVLALTAGAYFSWDYWTAGRFYISTDDAYVKADNTTIAPKVSAYIGGVLVGDNEAVKSGQLLARIDDRDFRVSVDQAKADVEIAKAAIANKQALLTAQQSVIEAARATIEVDQATLTFAEQDDARYSHLASTGYGSIQNAQQAASRLAAARASVARETAYLESATRQLDVRTRRL
jgi:membrane fusion protein (multidrug efflux system)